MKYFILKKFDDDSLEEFVTFCNDAGDIRKHILMDCTGGNLAVSNCFLSLINEDPVDYKLTAYGAVASAAFDFLIHVKCYKTITDQAVGIIHLPGRDLHTRDLRDKDSFEYWLSQNETQESYDNAMEFYKNYLTQDELDIVSQGKEVFIKASRLKEMLTVAV